MLHGVYACVSNMPVCMCQFSPAVPVISSLSSSLHPCWSFSLLYFTSTSTILYVYLLLPLMGEGKENILGVKAACYMETGGRQAVFQACLAGL